MPPPSPSAPGRIRRWARLCPTSAAGIRGFRRFGGEQGAFVQIGLQGVDGQEFEYALVAAAFDPDAIMAVLGEIQAHTLAGCPLFDYGAEFGEGVLGGILGSDDGQILAHGFGVAGADLDAGDLVEQPGQYPRRCVRLRWWGNRLDSA